ncbi:MAG: hydantoinase/oxoprolinase family protein [Planctomycetaceae bacterium]
MHFLGLDIGGANIKLATHDVAVRSVPFAMWKQYEQLTATLIDHCVGVFANPTMIGLTMTAELADCFPDKTAGVQFVVNATVAAFPGKPVRVWMTSGEFAEPADAVELPLLVAAANWHALATWAARAAPVGPALLIDIGSTTTDIIPLYQGVPVSEGSCDIQRLVHSELLYTGATRTPVCAVAKSVEVEGLLIPLAAELFATMKDVRLIRGELPEDPSDFDTADGRPATRPCAASRLAHMLCCDTQELDEQQIRQIADQLHLEQIQQVEAGIRNRLEFLKTQQFGASSNPVLLISGSGRDLVRQAIQRIDDTEYSSVMDLSKMWKTDITDCACVCGRSPGIGKVPGRSASDAGICSKSFHFLAPEF